MDELALHLPRFAAGAACLAVLYGLSRYKRNNDFNLWMREQHRDISRAAADSAYCRERLANANAEMASFGPENSASPVTKRQEVVLRAYPRLMFLLGGLGVAMIFIAVISPAEAGRVDWPLYAGPVFVLIAAVLYGFHRRERRFFRRVQVLNRKYLLEKTLNDDGMFATMRELLLYYPSLVPLWVEVANQHADRGDMAAAFGILREAEAAIPDNLDLALTECSLFLRQGDRKGAEKALKRAESYPRQATDPRIELYYAAISLEKGDKAAAKSHIEAAVTLDSRFVAGNIPQEPAFSGLKTLAEEENLVDFGY